MKKNLFLLIAFIFLCNTFFATAQDTLKHKTADKIVFTITEEMPQFPGGQEKLMEFISANLKYHTIQKSDDMRGKIYITFVVDSTGKILNPKILKGANEDLNIEAMRVVNLMPNWIPGKFKGRNVSVQYNLPINVELK